MKIAESFFLRLLHQEDALDAVETLSDFWCTRLEDRHSFNGLSETEKTVQLCLVYTAEVVNGGHAQYFLNSTGAYAAEAVIALKIIGANEMSVTLETAMHTTEVEPERSNALHALDQKCDVYLSEIDRLCQVFLRANQDDVLLPERSPQR